MKKIYSDANEAVIRNVPQNSTVLDVGCGSGILGERLKQKGCIVYGIDSDKLSLKEASKRLDKVFLIDIEEKKPELDKHFDVVVFADVLEHLKNPENVLKTYSSFVNKKGKIIVSVPNIANWTIRLKLLFGKFKYTETGILDKTHLHFYTLDTAKKMISKAGYKIIKIDITPNFVRSLLPLIKYISRIFGIKGASHEIHEKLLSSSFYKIYYYLSLPLETAIAKLWKSLFAYQLIFVAIKK